MKTTICKITAQFTIAWLTLLALAALPAAGRATTITVTNTADSGAGTLRVALASAANGDTINFSLTTPAKIILTGGELVISKNVNIVGLGATNLAVDGNAASRVFHIRSNTVVSITALMITNGNEGLSGYLDHSGGGILNDHATLTVSNCTFNANRAWLGGAIFNDHGALTVRNGLLSGNTAIGGGAIANLVASLRIANSIISRNFTQGSGGGIYNFDGYSSATVEIVGSTLSANSSNTGGNNADGGGGIYNISALGGSASVIVSNSTLSGNYAGSGGGIKNEAETDGNASIQIVNSTLNSNGSGDGGTIVNDGPSPGATANLQIVNSTVSGASSGYGFYNSVILNNSHSGTLRILNSTLSGDPAGSIANRGSVSVEVGSSILNSFRIYNDSGAFTSLGYNLSSDDGSGVLTNATDQVNSDPMLGPLQDNGGPTFTHAFTCRSPAIDHGKNFSGSANDQRGAGFARTFDDPAAENANSGDGTDIGAFEAQQPLPLCDDPPVADASATVALVISPDGTSALVILDGSRSSDPDGDTLQHNWSESGNPLTTGVVAVTVLSVGVHTVTLVVNDGQLSATNDITIEVITEAEAVNRLAASLSSSVPHPQQLVASLRTALASIDRSNPTAASNQLVAFQNKLHVQVEPLDPALAASLIQAAQQIIDSLSDGNTNPGGHPHGKFTSLTRQFNGHMRMQFSAEAPGTYIVEASSNLVNWEMIGVIGSATNSLCEFEDSRSPRIASRFYRVVRP